MDTWQFIAEHLHDDVHDLALKNIPAGVDKTLALCQIEARQLLAKKVPSWSTNMELLFPAHLSIEQCSSETTAQYKASLLRGSTFVDLTGGLGVDCCFVSKNFQHTDYVELNPRLCELAQHNFEVLHQPITIHNEPAASFLERCNPVDVIFLDPARRDQHGRKMVSITDCTPDVVALQDFLLSKASLVMVKLSPMLDITKALQELCHVKEVHVVAVANECKELLFLLERDFEAQPSFTCVNLQTSQPKVSYVASDCRHDEGGETPRSFLYEPNAALMKAGCFGLLAQRYGLLQLHPNSHLFTSDRLIADFPGRVFVVEGWAPYNKRIKATLLQGVDRASIATRNFPLSVAELRKALSIADGDEVFLFATTVSPQEKVIIKTRKTS